MIDYTKILLTGIDTERLEQLYSLDFKRDLSVSTGEISNTKVADYHFCSISIYESGNVFFSGSIHKLYNSLMDIKAPNHRYAKSKGFNGNQFNIDNVFYVREHLENLFDCLPNQMQFLNIEFGLNLNIWFNPKLFVRGLMFHYGVPFEFKRSFNYAQAVHQQYYLKIYNKSFQYGMKGNTLRVEAKILRSELLKPLGVKTFADITERTLDNAKTYLLEKLSEIIYIDPTIRKDELTNKEKSLLKDYSSPLYWVGIPSNHRDRPKKKLRQIILNHSDNLLKKIKQNIIQKCVTINRHSERSKCVTINTSSIGLNVTQNPLKICPVTGVDISMQKDKSYLLSNTGLKYLEKVDPEQFDFIKHTLLTGAKNKFEKDIYSRISKQIRNRYNSNKQKYITPELSF